MKNILDDQHGPAASGLEPRRPDDSDARLNMEVGRRYARSAGQTGAQVSVSIIVTLGTMARNDSERAGHQQTPGTIIGGARARPRPERRHGSRKRRITCAPAGELCEWSGTLS